MQASAGRQPGVERTLVIMYMQDVGLAVVDLIYQCDYCAHVQLATARQQYDILSGAGSTVMQWLVTETVVVDAE